MSRKTLLMWIMIIFIIGNGIAAVATSFTVLLIARVVSAFAHGVLCQLDLHCGALVPENKRASAIAFMFTGLTVATITGVPIGTFIGQQFGWRASFIVIVAIGIVALIANSMLIPSNLKRYVCIISRSI